MGSRDRRCGDGLRVRCERQQYTPGERAQRLQDLLSEHNMKQQLLKQYEEVPHHDEERVHRILRGDIAEFATEPVPGEMSIPRQLLIDRCKEFWPTVAADLDEASRNELSVAKAGQRGWYERIAIAWAERNGRVVQRTRSVWFPGG